LRTFLAGSILNTFHLTVPTPGGRTPEASQTPACFNSDWHLAN